MPAKEMPVIERRQIEHAQLLQLGRMLLLLVERQDPPLEFPSATNLNEKIITMEDLVKAS